MLQLTISISDINYSSIAERFAGEWWKVLFVKFMSEKSLKEAMLIKIKSDRTIEKINKFLYNKGLPITIRKLEVVEVSLSDTSLFFQIFLTKLTMQP